jgi:hypothetical protein
MNFLQLFTDGGIAKANAKELTSGENFVLRRENFPWISSLLNLFERKIYPTNKLFDVIYPTWRKDENKLW